jgi:hypothetical protein
MAQDTSNNVQQLNKNIELLDKQCFTENSSDNNNSKNEVVLEKYTGRQTVKEKQHKSIGKYLIRLKV